MRVWNVAYLTSLLAACDLDRGPCQLVPSPGGERSLRDRGFGLLHQVVDAALDLTAHIQVGDDLGKGGAAGALAGKLERPEKGR
jgi:hypothetical protein